MLALSVNTLTHYLTQKPYTNPEFFSQFINFHKMATLKKCNVILTLLRGSAIVAHICSPRVQFPIILGNSIPKDQNSNRKSCPEGWKYGWKIELCKRKQGLRIDSKPLFLLVAGATRLELATSGVTGRRSNQN